MNWKGTQRAFSLFQKLNQTFESHARIAIVGNGVSGLLASAFLPKFSGVRVHQLKVFSSKLNHSYDPGLQFIAGGILGDEEFQAPVLSVFDDFLNFDFNDVIRIDPEKRLITNFEDKEINYDYLVVASGLESDYSSVKGLKEALEDPSSKVIACGNVLESLAAKAILESHYQGGKVLFVNPGHQKTRRFFEAHNVLMLWQDALKKKGTGLLNSSPLLYYSEEPALVPTDPKLSVFLGKNFEENGVESKFNRKLLEINSERKEATFLNFQTNEKETEQFSVLFLTVPQKLPDYLGDSGLLDQNGKLRVDIKTLHHQDYENIFGIGSTLLGKELYGSVNGTIEQSIVLASNISLKVAKVTFNEMNVTPFSYDGYNCQEIYMGKERLMFYESIEDRPITTEFRPSYWKYIQELLYNPKRYMRYIRKGRWFSRTGYKKPNVRLAE